MNITLSTDLKDYVASQVRSGHYISEDDVIIDALKNQMRQSFEKQIDARIEASRKQIASGDTIVADDDYFDRKIAMIKEKHLTKAK